MSNVEGASDDIQPVPELNLSSQQVSPTMAALDEQLKQQYISVLIDGIKKLLKGEHLSQKNIFRVAFALMYLTARMPVSGQSKKELLMAALSKYLDEETNLLPEEKLMCVMLLDTSISLAIDARYAAAGAHSRLKGKCCF